MGISYKIEYQNFGMFFVFYLIILFLNKYFKGQMVYYLQVIFLFLGDNGHSSNLKVDLFQMYS